MDVAAVEAVPCIVLDNSHLKLNSPPTVLVHSDLTSDMNHFFITLEKILLLGIKHVMYEIEGTDLESEARICPACSDFKLYINYTILHEKVRSMAEVRSLTEMYHAQAYSIISFSCKLSMP